MLALTLTRPAPPDTRDRRDDRDPAPAAAVLKFLLWTGTLKPLVQGVLIVFACGYWVTNQTIRGRFRYHLRPVWVAFAACYVTAWTPWLWLVAGFALDLAPNPGRWVSEREQGILARACGLAAAFQVFAPGMDWQVHAALFVEFATVGLLPWWRSRSWRSDPEPALEAHPLVEAWAWQVAEHPKAGPLAFTELAYDPEADRFHLRAPIDGEDGVEKAAERACRLMCRPRGTITISPNPDGDANDFYVAFTERHDATVVRYWTDGDVTTQGTFETADSADGRAAVAAVRGSSGAAHVLILAPSRHGKGVIMRQFGVALARWDRAFLNVADCKGENQGGAGVPELRSAADVYGWTRDQWRACVEMHHELFSARASRYGKPGVGRNFWHPDAVVDGYADPLATLMIDEQRKMTRAWGSAVVGKLEDMASQGASFGVGLIVNTQKGDADSLGSTTFRNDLRGNGTVYIGRYADAQAARDAVQGFDVDPMQLPAAAGWWFIRSALQPIPLVAMRGRMLPTRDELEFMDFTAPYGTVEDWLVGTMRAKLHPQDQDIVEKWRDWFEDTPAQELAAEPEPKPEPSELKPERVQREVITVVDEPVDGVHVERPRLTAVPDLHPDTLPARDLIPDTVRKAGRAMTRGEIASATGLAPGYVSDRLKLLKTEGKMIEAKTPKGEAGWTVAA